MVLAGQEFVDLMNQVGDELVAPNQKHLFMSELIRVLDKFVVPDQRSMVKRVLMHTLKNFSKDKSREVHFEMLHLWPILSDYSETMTLKEILDRVDYLYDDHLPYYRIYITELLSMRQRDVALKMLERCKERCNLTDDQLSDEFPTLVEKKPAAIESTINIMESLGYRTTVSDDVHMDDSLCSQAENMRLRGVRSYTDSKKTPQKTLNFGDNAGGKADQTPQKTVYFGGDAVVKKEFEEPQNDLGNDASAKKEAKKPQYNVALSPLVEQESTHQDEDFYYALKIEREKAKIALQQRANLVSRISELEERVKQKKLKNAELQQRLGHVKVSA